jgi:hypothetical protein
MTPSTSTFREVAVSMLAKVKHTQHEPMLFGSLDNTLIELSYARSFPLYFAFNSGDHFGLPKRKLIELEILSVLGLFSENNGTTADEEGYYQWMSNKNDLYQHLSVVIE